MLCHSYMESVHNHFKNLRNTNTIRSQRKKIGHSNKLQDRCIMWFEFKWRYLNSTDLSNSNLNTNRSVIWSFPYKLVKLLHSRSKCSTDSTYISTWLFHQSWSKAQRVCQTITRWLIMYVSWVSMYNRLFLTVLYGEWIIS